MTNEIHKFFKVGAFLYTFEKAGGMREMRLQYYVYALFFCGGFSGLWLAPMMCFANCMRIIHIQIPLRLRMNTPSQCNL